MSKAVLLDMAVAWGMPVFLASSAPLRKSKAWGDNYSSASCWFLASAATETRELSQRLVEKHPTTKNRYADNVTIVLKKAGYLRSAVGKMSNSYNFKVNDVFIRILHASAWRTRMRCASDVRIWFWREVRRLTGWSIAASQLRTCDRDWGPSFCFGDEWVCCLSSEDASGTATVASQLTMQSREFQSPSCSVLADIGCLYAYPTISDWTKFSLIQWFVPYSISFSRRR